MEHPVIEFRNVTKRFGDVAAVVENNLAVTAGEFLSILGPSGCGKTTSLRMMAGFEQPSEGYVFISGQDMTGFPPTGAPSIWCSSTTPCFRTCRSAKMCPTACASAAPSRHAANSSREVAEALAMVRLEGYENRRSHELSGGQQQRVALARALINRPAVLLLDEPLAALDRKLRREMQIELQNLQRDVGITFLLVTHDQEEALSMSDRVCVMREGRIIQSGSPRELYDKPVNRYVADFVGKSNFFAGPTKDTIISVRPELVEIAAKEAELPPGLSAHFSVKVLNRIFLGENTEYRVVHDGLGEFMVLTPRKSERSTGTFEIGDTAATGWRPEAALVLAAN